MKRTGMVLLVLAGVLLGGCGSTETTDAGNDGAMAAESPTPTPTPTELTYVETDACRSGAGPVLDIIAMALTDEDVREVAGRLDTLDSMLPEALAQCTGATARPAREAIDSLDAALAAAMDGVAPGQELATAAERLEDAQAALDATT